jgi:CorA-like Mg2+ transporter protein
VIVVHAILSASAAGNGSIIQRKTLEPPERIRRARSGSTSSSRRSRRTGKFRPSLASQRRLRPARKNGVRYLQASFVSEPDETPDIIDVTFVIAPTSLVMLAVIFMPPTVIASIYGMNFKVMPGARMELGLSDGDRSDDLRRDRTVSVLPLEEVALRADLRSSRAMFGGVRISAGAASIELENFL